MDSAGTVHDHRFFEPFGQRIDADGGPSSGGMAGVELGFTGHRHDGDLGLIDMRGRVYDPVQKHFLSPDPLIGTPLSGQDLNRYSYAWNNPLSIVDPTGLQESPGGFRLPTPLPTSTDAILSFFKSLFSPTPAPSPAGPSPEKKGQTPSPPTSDGQGARPSTGSGAAPTPQELPPGTTPRPRSADEVDQNGFVPYNAGIQRSGGFVAGVSIGLVPLGSLVANALIAKGVLAEGTPEAREGLANGQLLGGLIGMVWGAGKAPSAAPVQAPRPVPATAGGGSAPPLVVVPDATGVLLGVGGVVTIAAAGAEMAVALTSGGGDGGKDAGGETPIKLRPEKGYLGSKKHGIHWKEGPATAKMTQKPQGQWGSAADLEFAADKASTLVPGEGGWFQLPSGHTSVVHRPDGTAAAATRIWVRNNGTGTFHGYPAE